MRGPSVEASRHTEVESRTTRKRRNSHSGVFCVAKQRPVRRFTALGHVMCMEMSISMSHLHVGGLGMGQKLIAFQATTLVLKARQICLLHQKI